MLPVLWVFKRLVWFTNFSRENIFVSLMNQVDHQSEKNV